MKILLCGSSGRVGGEIMQIGSLLGTNIIAYSSSQLDITSPNNIATIVSKIEPDMVLMLLLILI